MTSTSWCPLKFNLEPLVETLGPQSVDGASVIIYGMLGVLQGGAAWMLRVPGVGAWARGCLVMSYGESGCGRPALCHTSGTQLPPSHNATRLIMEDSWCNQQHVPYTGVVHTHTHTHRGCTPGLSSITHTHTQQVAPASLSRPRIHNDHLRCSHLRSSQDPMIAPFSLPVVQPTRATSLVVCPSFCSSVLP